MRRLLSKPDVPWLAAAAAACVLLLGSLFVPLWRMELVAPQYPEGLAMFAYGYRFSDDPGSPYHDIREINGLNHYIGMKPIEEVTEMQLFVPAVLTLAAAGLLMSFVAWKRRWLRALTIAAFWLVPAFFVADLQYWLYHYGHTMDPTAALDTGPFTPKVFGTTQVWNFHSKTAFEVGFYLLVAAALVISFMPPTIRRLQRGRAPRETERRAKEGGRRSLGVGRGALVAKAIVVSSGLMLAALPWVEPAQGQETVPASELQHRIDAASPDDTLIIDGGVYEGQIVIDRPVALIGRNRPVIDGGGEGDVVTVRADDVIISGFVIRGSGRSISQEPAAIKIDQADRVTVRANHVEDSHFGIYLLGSSRSVLASNVVDLGTETPVERRGHGIYLWETSDTAIHGNAIRNAGDGIHLEFSQGNGIGANSVSGSRYGLHFMYANGNRVLENSFRENLAGAVVMFSRDLLLKDNDLSENRSGATGIGLLLKDVDDIFAEGNRLVRNRYGMSAEGSPQSVGATAVFMKNLFALNDTGIGVMSNSPITFVENALIDNPVQVRALGGAITTRMLSGHGGDTAAHHGGAHAAQQAAPPKGAVWTIDGRGNYWSDYRGYDADGDGVGDRPYTPDPPLAGLLERDETLRLFQFTLAQQAIETAADMFPIYRYEAVIEDGGPLMSPPAGTALPKNRAFNADLLAVSLLLVACSAGALMAAFSGRWLLFWPASHAAASSGAIGRRGAA